MNRMSPTMELPWTSWRDTEGDASRLLTTVLINGCSMHLEAFAVETVGGVQTSLTRDDDLSAIHAAVGADGPWETCRIAGREYVLVASPYSN